jgi:hypothetical protein
LRKEDEQAKHEEQKHQLNGLSRKAIVVLAAAEALLLGGGDDLTVPQQDRGGI